MDLIKLDTILGIEQLSDIEAEHCSGGFSINANQVSFNANNVSIVVNEINASLIPSGGLNA